LEQVERWNTLEHLFHLRPQKIDGKFLAAASGSDRAARQTFPAWLSYNYPNMFLKLSRSFAFLALLTFASLAQTPYTPPSEHWKSNFDVQNYLIYSTIDYAEKKVTGITTVTLKPLADGFASFDLDAAGMAFESVTLDDGASGKSLQFKNTADKLSITLDKAYPASATLAVTIKYVITNPAHGVHFVTEMKDKDRLLHPRQVWTHGEAEENHFWFPCYDHPDDKATSEQYVTVPSGDVAVANGQFLDATENINGTKTWHFKMTMPHSTYLTSFVAGDYARVEAKYGDVPLGYYTYRGTEDIAQAAYGKTPKMMALYEKLTGVKFPYPKYDQTIVAEYPFGGMENITATTMADSEILAARLEMMRPFTDDLVSHELAHSWFGDLVTCKTWSQLWLNEGFATFMEAVFKESEGGRKAYMLKVREDAARFMAEDLSNTNKHALVNKKAVPNDDLFDVTTYQKGGVVLYMLRETVGDEAFWKAINLYLNRHKFGSVETADLQSAMEEASSQKLDWFFNEWVYSEGFPELRVKTSYLPAKKTLVLDVQQVQAKTADTVAAYKMPLEIEVSSARGATVKRTIELEKARQVFSIPVTFAPKKVVFDKNERMILKNVKFSGTVPAETVPLNSIGLIISGSGGNAQ
jgi:aminopeptidase N